MERDRVGHRDRRQAGARSLAHVKVGPSTAPVSQAAKKLQHSPVSRKKSILSVLIIKMLSVYFYPFQTLHAVTYIQVWKLQGQVNGFNVKSGPDTDVPSGVGTLSTFRIPAYYFLKECALQRPTETRSGVQVRLLGLSPPSAASLVNSVAPPASAAVPAAPCPGHSNGSSLWSRGGSLQRVKV